MKMQLTPRFPAQVIGLRGISIAAANGIYTFTFSRSTRLIAAQGPVAIGVNDDIVVIRKTIAELTTIQLPLAATMAGPVTIVDGAGVWGNPAFNATILPSGVETIAGLNQILGDANYGGFTLIPIATVGYVFAP